MVHLQFAMSPSQHFMDSLMDRVICNLRRAHPEIGEPVSVRTQDTLFIEANFEHHNPELHHRHTIRVNQDKVISAIASILNGFRVDIPAGIPESIYHALLQDDPDLIPHDTVKIVSEIAVFGSSRLLKAV